MYGTAAKMRIKADAEARLRELMEQFETLEVPGYVSSTVYRMDADANDVYLAVVFDSRETYQANAQSPDQDVRYREMRELLEADPELNDGEIVYSG